MRPHRPLSGTETVGVLISLLMFLVAGMYQLRRHDSLTAIFFLLVAIYVKVPFWRRPE